MLDAIAVLLRMSRLERRRLELLVQGAEVAHLKMTLSPDVGLGDIAVINLVRNDFVPELSQNIEEPVASGQLTPNPSSLNFGSVPPGSKKTLSETLSNSGAAALTISQIAPSGVGFSFSGITLPVTLIPDCMRSKPAVVDGPRCGG